MTRSRAPRGNGATVGATEKVALDKPISAGSITVGESAEIKERSRLIEKAMSQIDRTQKLLTDQKRVKALLESERLAYLRQVCDQRGLSRENDYSVDAESGTIWLIAETKQVQPITDTEPVEIEQT